MHAKGVERIVEAQGVLELDAEVAGDAAEKPHEEGAGLVDVARPGRDHHQARNAATDNAQHRGLALEQPLDGHPRQAGCRGRDVSHQHRHAGATAGRQRRPGVKAEPAHPQQRGADEGQEHVVRGGLSGLEALARAQDHRANKSRHARGNVHDVAARKVQHAPRSHEASAPLPVGNGAVDEEVPEEHEDEDRDELHALGEGAGNDRTPASSAPG